MQMEQLAHLVMAKNPVLLMNPLGRMEKQSVRLKARSKLQVGENRSRHLQLMVQPV
jgi:hypothetical protein